MQEFYTFTASISYLCLWDSPSELICASVSGTTLSAVAAAPCQYAIIQLTFIQIHWGSKNLFIDINNKTDNITILSRITSYYICIWNKNTWVLFVSHHTAIFMLLFFLFIKMAYGKIVWMCRILIFLSIENSHVQ